MSRREPDEDEEVHFADAVSEEEGRAVKRRHIFDPDSIYFRGGFIVALLGAFLTCCGGVWGIAIAFSGFKTGQENTRADVDDLRKQIVAMRKRVLLIKEGDLWADSMRFQNAGKIIVPKPSDFKIEQE